MLYNVKVTIYNVLKMLASFSYLLRNISARHRAAHMDISVCRFRQLWIWAWWVFWSMIQCVYRYCVQTPIIQCYQFNGFNASTQHCDVNVIKRLKGHLTANSAVPRGFYANYPERFTHFVLRLTWEDVILLVLLTGPWQDRGYWGLGWVADWQVISCCISPAHTTQTVVHLIFITAAHMDPIYFFCWTQQWFFSTDRWYSFTTCKRNDISKGSEKRWMILF